MNSEEHGKNDSAFEAVLHNTGNVDLFVDEFFSFLARRTDFFVVSPPEGGQLGFPPGVAAKLIISKFKKWESFQNGVRNLNQSSGQASSADSPVPEPISTIEIAEDNPASEFPEEKSQSLSANTTSTKTSNIFRENPSDSYNGRKTNAYSWSQSIKELDIHVFVGEDVKTKRDVEVKILSDRIKVTVPSLPNPVLVDWKLANGVIKDESYWSLHPGEAVFFSLQKSRELWWDHLFEGEEAIDRTKIEAVRPMEELDEEEQAKIHELMFNQEQKLKGLPTSDQMKLTEVMKKAWDVEGSPFKGQPFDPTQVQLADNAVDFSNS